jgi:acetoin utilization deacetylase AcuC-like enzyme
MSAKFNNKFPIIYSDSFLNHDTGVYHPENAGRLIAIVEALKNSAIATQLTWQEPTAIASRKLSGQDILQEVRRFHTQKYL